MESRPRRSFPSFFFKITIFWKHHPHPPGQKEGRPGGGNPTLEAKTPPRRRCGTATRLRTRSRRCPSSSRTAGSPCSRRSSRRARRAARTRARCSPCSATRSRARRSRQGRAEPQKGHSRPSMGGSKTSKCRFGRACRVPGYAGVGAPGGVGGGAAVRAGAVARAEGPPRGRGGGGPGVRLQGPPRRSHRPAAPYQRRSCRQRNGAASEHRKGTINS